MTARRNSIPIWRKQEVITWILEEGNSVPSRAVKHFRDLGLNVDGATICKWWRSREQIMAAKLNQRRVSGGGRKPLCENMEDMLYDLIIDKRLRKEKVTREWIANQAVAVYASLHAEKTQPRRSQPLSTGSRTSWPATPSRFAVAPTSRRSPPTHSSAELCRACATYTTSCPRWTAIALS
ncbi:unnamed protein product [Phytophthora lilii]|uniref:Unnamed protein product n=1 Tax=Phytophthora lilii TaxID=2077276 RepID=A0A9W6WYT3_9STRA|nr:unnamed protein product [Phytophthora lilii]